MQTGRPKNNIWVHDENKSNCGNCEDDDNGDEDKTNCGKTCVTGSWRDWKERWIDWWTDNDQRLFLVWWWVSRLPSEMPTSELPTSRQIWGRHYNNNPSSEMPTLVILLYFQMWMPGSSSLWLGGGQKLFWTNQTRNTLLIQIDCAFCGKWIWINHQLRKHISSKH